MSQTPLGILQTITEAVALADYVRQRVTPFRRVEESTQETFDRLLVELVQACPQYAGWHVPPRR